MKLSCMHIDCSRRQSESVMQQVPQSETMRSRSPAPPNPGFLISHCSMLEMPAVDRWFPSEHSTTEQHEQALVPENKLGQVTQG